jgi:molybdenum cofactor cytidylyltransferase
MPLAGRPVLEWTLRAVLASSAGTVVVVCGHQQRKPRQLIQNLRREYGLRLRLCFNPRWRQGMGSTLAQGVAALPPHCEAAVVCLADLPRLQPQVIDALIDELIAAQGSDVAAVQAQYRNGIGHPVLLSASLFPALRALDADEGARGLLRGRADLRRIAVAQDLPEDLDTAQQYRRLRRRFETRPRI